MQETWNIADFKAVELSVKVAVGVPVTAATATIGIVAGPAYVFESEGVITKLVVAPKTQRVASLIYNRIVAEIF